MQVIEHHLINNLEEIFSPLTVSRWSDEEVLSIASEPAGVMRQMAAVFRRVYELSNI
jgi:hypothetical protein